MLWLWLVIPWCQAVEDVRDVDVFVVTTVIEVIAVKAELFKICEFLKGFWVGCYREMKKVSVWIYIVRLLMIWTESSDVRRSARDQSSARIPTSIIRK